MIPEDEVMIDEVGDTKIVLADGRQLTYRELGRIMMELGDTNLLRTIHLLPSEDVQQAAYSFQWCVHYLNRMQQAGNAK